MIKEKPEKSITEVEIATDAYEKLCNLALDYMQRFKSDDSIIEENYSLKREHTSRVIGYTEVITRSLNLDSILIQTAQLTALLHDIGRFEQFRQFNTFNDSTSVDHAALGVGIIEQNNWLDELPTDIQQIIKNAIKYHNLIEIPKCENKDEELVAKVIRDADKIDILLTAAKEFSASNNSNNKHYTLELDPSNTVSKNVTKAIVSGRLPHKKDLKTVNDFKLMLMAFVFDVNFKISFSIINKNQVLKSIFDTLPKKDEVFEIYRTTKIHVQNQLI